MRAVEAADMSTERLTLSIRGLTCASSVAQIEQAMRQQEGVIWATINFAAEDATVVYDSTTFDLARLVQAVSRLGYQVVVGTSQLLELETTLPVRRRLLQTGSWGRAWRP
jgi:Cu+-exporting ATPase